MRLQEFIFSEEKSHRSRRHILFWTVLAILFFFQSLVEPYMFSTALVSLLCFFPACIACTYIALDFIVPRFLLRKRYKKFLLAFLALTTALIILNYAAAILFYKLARDYPDYLLSVAPVLGLAYINSSHALIIAGLASAIRFSKNWYLQQKENMELAKQQTVMELQLEKAKVYPRFLFQSLLKISSGSIGDSHQSSEFLLKISDLLSYLLYDANECLITLEKELEAVKNLVEIERKSQRLNFYANINANGDAKSLVIIPMTLFSLVENFLEAVGNDPEISHRLDLDISVEDITVKAWLKLSPVSLDRTQSPGLSNHFEKFGTRLKTLYPVDSRFDIWVQEAELKIFVSIKADKNLYNDTYFNQGQLDVLTHDFS